MSEPTIIHLEIELRSFWRIGSGRGQGALHDATILRDRDGLPYVPGRSLRGLLRDAFAKLEAWDHLTKGLTVELFGTEGAAALSAANGETRSGTVAVSNAVLSPQVRAKLLDSGDMASTMREALTRTVYATAIEEETGSAKDHSLRTDEVAVPMKLYGELELAADLSREKCDQVMAKLNEALSLITGLGARRNRGFGEVIIRPIVPKKQSESGGQS